VVVSGFHPVRELLEKRPRAVEALFLQRGRKDARAAGIETLARAAGVPVRLVAKEELDRLAGRANNGVAARVAERDYDAVEDCLAGPKGKRCVLFLDEVTDPGNLGSVLRTAAAAGASVVLTERHSAGLNEAVSKTSAGALERVRVGRVVNAARFLGQAKEAGFWIYGASLEGESLWNVDISGDAVLCLGSEGAGLRRLTKETCDRLISIPMSSGAGSLNVSVAAGILVWEWLRRRTGPG
jgi:23S rRNA (guanosine2251-2'-O)-methyltransferase